ncbi:MAG: hypothetical protein EDS66_17505 [Planctomycetota bacterium]|nr:MAG: hypothetical protein EDS66_17505 [Planctomycetota bacterium]
MRVTPPRTPRPAETRRSATPDRAGTHGRADRRLPMPQRTDAPLDPAERRRQVTSILARGVMRWRRQARSTAIMHAQKSAPTGENRLELSRETRLSVSDGTRGFTMRADGDDA